MTYLILIPPIATIVLALWTKEVFSSLLVGIIIGIGLVHGFDLSIFSNLLDKYFLGALVDQDHLKVIIFSLCIGGIASLLQYNGGIQGLIQYISRKERSKRSIELYTYFLGLTVFFDDYANTLITGNAMQRLFDKYKISREKLALIVDTTSAPITSIAFITTWIGFELSQISEPLKTLNAELSAYDLFLGSLKFAFYPILMLLFIFGVIWFQKDIGLIKEARPKPYRDIETLPGNIWKLILPILLLISSTLCFLIINGNSSSEYYWKLIPKYIGDGDPFSALFYSSTLTLVLSLIWNRTSNTSLKQDLRYVITGFKHMATPIGILILAWMYGQVMKDLNAGQILSENLNPDLSLIYFPVSIFIFGAIISFTTGSSFSTMGIIYPLVIPIIYNLAPDNIQLLELSIACVLGGAVFGDHCSPISDTTIMSSMSSGVNHISHVKTQLPYALIAGTFSIAVIVVVTSLII